MRRKWDTADGRGVAFAGLVVGVAVSVAGNVAHAFVPPPDAAPGWGPPVGLVLSAPAWPLILFLAVEVMLQVPWPSAWYYAAVRWGGLSVVALVAGYISYQHLSALLTYWGEDALTTPVGPVVLNAADLGPFAVDGLMVMCAGALLALRDRQPARPQLAITVVGGGGGGGSGRATASGTGGGPGGLVIEPDPDGGVPHVVPTPAPDPPRVNGARPVSKNAQLVLAALPGTVADLARRSGVKRTTVDYVLARTLQDRVRQDDGGVWKLTDGSP
jgi:hypothetical protein